MEYLLGTLIVILFPAFLVVAPLFPFWWVGRYRRLRREGRWDSIRDHDRNWKRLVLKVVGLAYGLLLAGLLFICFGSSPSWMELDRLLMTLVVIASALLVLDAAILMGFSPDRAVELRRSEENGRRP